MVTGPFAPNSFSLLQEALAFWRELGYLYVDLPWTVEPRYVEATRPGGLPLGVATDHGVLVASHEQSFLALAGAQRLLSAPGYVGWTPCFREEVCFDQWHHFGFIKAEVFTPVAGFERGVEALPRLLHRQCELFENLAQSAGYYTADIGAVVISPVHTDILVNGIKVGSYGVRAVEGLSYLYGTALALPRFSQALRHRG